MKKYMTEPEKAPVKKKKEKMSTAKKAILISLAVVLAAGLFYIGRLAYFAFIDPSAAFNHDVAGAITEESPSETPTAEPTDVQPSESAEPTPTPSLDPEAEMLSKADLGFIKDRTNVLLIGIDENPQRDATGRKDFRTDVMMLLSIDFTNKTVHVLSVPRDSYADIYGTNERWKLNGAFMKGGGYDGKGFEYTLKSVSMLLGLDQAPIQYYACVQMTGLKNLIDALGGIDYNVDVSAKLDGHTIKPGMQHLNGSQALQYARVRKGIGDGTDIGRTDRQQKLMLALFQQLQSADKLTLIPKAFEAMKDQIWTNLSMEQIIALVVFAKDVDMGNIKRYALKGKYVNAYNAKYYVLDQTVTKDVVSKIFGIDKSHIKLNTRYDIDFVTADVAAQSALNTAAAFVKKYGTKMTDAQKSSLNNLVSQVKSAKRNLPSGMSTVKSLSKKLTSLCYSIEQEIKKPPEPSPGTSPKPSTSPTTSPPTSPEPSKPASSESPAAS